MRVPIAVQVKSFDIEDVQPQVDMVRETFVRYIADVPIKSTRSKHGLMGPVGKILSEIRSGRRDAASLKGYAVRVQEASGRSLSPQTLEALEEGIQGILALLSQVPITAQDRVLDRLDYGLYFDLRKKAIGSKEARRQAWVAFLRARYGDEEALSEAWREEVRSFDSIYLPRKAEGAKGRNATARERDVAAFWESQGAVADLEDDDEGE